MAASFRPRTVYLDVLGLFLAGFNNTILALLVAVSIHDPGTATSQPDLLQRAAWITEHSFLRKAGWIFWFAPTLSFSWSYYALDRHLGGARQWRDPAIGIAVIAAAVDIAGVLLNFTVLPTLAQELVATAVSPDPTLQAVFQAMERMANNLTNVGGYGLYSLAGIMLLPAVYATRDLPRPLAWLGAAEWGIPILATVLLVVAPSLSPVPLVISFLLLAPWVWGGGIWLLRRKAPA